VELNDNGLIYEIQMENGIEVARSIKCAFLKLDIICPDAVAVNQEMNITLTYLDYLGNPQTNSDNITTEISYGGEVIAAQTVKPVNGIGNLLLEFAGSGEYQISATGNCTCEPAGKKVMVNG